MFDKIKRLIGHVLVYGLGNAGTRVIGFLLIPVYSRYITPEDYGVLALVGMFGQVLFTIMNMGQNSALFRTYLSHDDAGGRETVISTSLLLILVLSFPIGLLALILARPLSILLSDSPAYSFWVVLAIGGVAFKTLLRLPLAVLRVREQSHRYAAFSVAQTLVALVLAIIFVVGVNMGGQGVLLSQLLAEVVICAYLLPSILRGLSLAFSKHDAHELLSYGLALIPAALLSFLLRLSDRYFLKTFFSVSVVGVYALGYRFGEIMSFVFLAFELAYPQFVFGHVKSPDAPALYARVGTYYLAFMGFLWLTVSLLAEETVKIMAAPAYHEAYHVIPWIAGAFLFQGLGWVWSVGLHLHRKAKYRLLIGVTTTALSLALNFLLIPRFGMVGAGAVALLSFMFQFSLQMVLGHRLYAVPYEYRRILRLAVIGAALYLIGISIGWGSIPIALLGKTLLLLSAPVLLYLSGFFQPGELDRMKSMLAGLRQGRIPMLPARGSGK